MNNLFKKFFKKEETTHSEILRLESSLSFERSLLDRELLQSVFAHEELSTSQIGFFSKYLSLQESASWTLADEIELLKKYIDIWKSLKIDIFTREQYDIEYMQSKKIAPLILLPLVQNAIINGYNSYEKYPLRIRVKAANDTMKMEVSNHANHHVLNQEDNSFMMTYKSRLQYLYGEQQQLIVNSNTKIFKVTLLFNFR